MSVAISILIAVITAVLGCVGGYVYRKQASEKKIGRTEEYAKNLLDDAMRKADERKKEQTDAQIGNLRGHDPERPHTQNRRRHGSYRITDKGPEAYLPPPGHHPRGIARNGGNSHDGDGGLGAKGQTQHRQQDYGRPGAHHPADGPRRNTA